MASVIYAKNRPPCIYCMAARGGGLSILGGFFNHVAESTHCGNLHSSQFRARTLYESVRDVFVCILIWLGRFPTALAIEIRCKFALLMLRPPAPDHCGGRKVRSNLILQVYTYTPPLFLTHQNATFQSSVVVPDLV